jgi:2-polyprenyl-3-methyl-5-hydroxy-6-metoxy-1,4-benzoquinol methylase
VRSDGETILQSVSSIREPDICLNIGLQERLLRKSLYAVLADAVEGAVPDKRPLSILDVGSGRGELMAALSARGHLVTGVDSNAKCVERGSQYGRCLVCGLDDLDHFFSTGEFNVIVCSHVLEHVSAPIEALTLGQISSR